jgi:hypothetical protein
MRFVADIWCPNGKEVDTTDEHGQPVKIVSPLDPRAPRSWRSKYLPRSGTSSSALSCSSFESEDADRQRANALADECGRLKDENRALLVENATLRRQVERLERKR